MGRKKVNCVYSYYESNETTSKCLICEKVLQGNHGSNLMKHLKCVHPSIHELVMKKNAALIKDDSSASLSSSCCKKFKTEANLLQECVKLTTVHGRPFSLIDDQAFQNIIALIPGQKEQTVNSYKVKKCVSKSASEMRNDLSKEIKNRLFSLKVDAATLGTRCFLGINIQYGTDDKTCVRNLGVIELYARHTSDYLAQNVIDTLSKYKLGFKHIYCCTTDNGANMLKMTKLLQDKLNSSSVDANDAIEDVNDENFDDEADIFSIESRVDPDIFQDDFDTALSSSIQYENFIIPTVRCAAHTLQLAIRDALKDEDTQNIIKLVRTLVKKLRTQNYAMFLKASNKRKPFLDCQTRWGSTYDMVERFLDYKDVVSGESSNDLFFSSENWLVVDDFLKSLKPSRVLTKILQTEQLTMSDFYGHWLKCGFETSETNTNLSKKLSKHMKERQEVLFTNDAFISAIYLDPRYNVILSREQQSAAREHLVRTYHRLISLEYEYEENENNITPVTPATTDQSEFNDNNQSNDSSQPISASDKLRHFISTKYFENRDPNILQNTSATNATDKLKDSLINFLNEPLLDHSENIFSYLKSKKKSFPLLYQLSQIVLSAPATQVTVERLFSSLKFVVSNLRMSLKDSLVDDILFIRNNSNNK